jgi:uncharacterized membrane protein YfhO
VEPAGAGRVAVTAGKAGEWDLTVDLVRPATAVISETFLRGWKVTEGPAGSGIGPSHDALIGISLPSGENRVRLRYDPWTVKTGLGLSLLALSILLATGVWSVYRLNKG